MNPKEKVRHALVVILLVLATLVPNSLVATCACLTYGEDFWKFFAIMNGISIILWIGHATSEW